jgi:hypothetical protein
MRARPDDSRRVRLLTVTIVVATAAETAGLLTYAWLLRSIACVVFALVCLGTAAVCGHGLPVTVDLSDLVPRAGNNRRRVRARRRHLTSTSRQPQRPHTFVTPGRSGPASALPRPARRDTTGSLTQPAGVAR